MFYTVSGLADVLNSQVIWDSFKGSIPFLFIVIVFSLGFYLLIRMIKGSSKGRVM